jgi:hypothetical protein
VNGCRLIPIRGLANNCGASRTNWTPTEGQADGNGVGIPRGGRYRAQCHRAGAIGNGWDTLKHIEDAWRTITRRGAGEWSGARSACQICPSRPPRVRNPSRAEFAFDLTPELRPSNGVLQSAGGVKSRAGLDNHSPWRDYSSPSIRCSKPLRRAVAMAALLILA